MANRLSPGRRHIYPKRVTMSYSTSSITDPMELKYTEGMSGKGNVPAKFLPKEAEKFAAVSMYYTVEETGRKRSAHYVLYKLIKDQGTPEERELWISLSTRRCPEEPNRPLQTWKIKKTSLPAWYYGLYTDRAGTPKTIRGADIKTIKVHKPVPEETEDIIKAMRFSEKLAMGD
jgi:hypothetical protein